MSALVLMNPRLVNAHKLSILYNDFDFPSEFDIRHIRKYDYVKVCYKNERFYVEVLGRLSNNDDYTKIRYRGIIANEIITTDRLKHRGGIEFFSKNIFSIYRPSS